MCWTACSYGVYMMTPSNWRRWCVCWSHCTKIEHQIGESESGSCTCMFELYIIDKKGFLSFWDRNVETCGRNKSQKSVIANLGFQMFQFLWNWQYINWWTNSELFPAYRRSKNKEIYSCKILDDTGMSLVGVPWKSLRCWCMGTSVRQSCVLKTTYCFVWNQRNLQSCNIMPGGQMCC